MRVKIIFRLSFLRTFDLRRTASEQPLPAALAPAVSPAPTATISENRRSDKPFTWVVDYPEGTWECPYALLQSLAAEAMKGFESSPAGGAELGGVLYGTRTGNHVRVTANLPVACEHRNGPAFTLSEPDQAGLDELLGGENEWTKGLKPVGWYHPGPNLSWTAGFQNDGRLYWYCGGKERRPSRWDFSREMLMVPLV
jgi:hypothetical protein